MGITTKLLNMMAQRGKTGHDSAQSGIQWNNSTLSMSSKPQTYGRFHRWNERTGPVSGRPARSIWSSGNRGIFLPIVFSACIWDYFDVNMYLQLILSIVVALMERSSTFLRKKNADGQRRRMTTRLTSLLFGRRCFLVSLLCLVSLLLISIPALIATLLLVWFFW